MRIRIATRGPLPPLKAWYGIDPSTVLNKPIAALKLDLISDLAHIFSSVTENFWLVLELDGFELLDESMVGSVVKDDDLIDITVSEATKLPKETQPTLGKRKMSEMSEAGEQVGPTPVKRPKPIFAISGSKISAAALVPPTSWASKPMPAKSSIPSVVPSSDSDSESGSNSDSSSDASSSDEESSNSSSGESFSSSNSSSGSSSSSSSTPSVKSNKHSAHVKERIIPQRSHTQHQLQQDFLKPLLRELPEKPHVPPGQGKQSTRERNRRRRLARQHQRAGAGIEADAGGSNTNVDSIHPKYSTIVSIDELNTSAEAPAQFSLPQAVTPPSGSKKDGGGGGELMMTSLKNSNKRKGFKDRQAGRHPERIVFDDSGANAAIVPPTLALSRFKSQPNLPQLIPPSERTDLPRNLFVTSVDVEADLWNGKGAKSNKNGKKSAKTGGGGTWNGYLDPSSFYPVGRAELTMEFEREAGEQFLPPGHGEMDMDVHLDYGEDEERQVASVLSKRGLHSNSTSTSTTTNGRSEFAVAAAAAAVSPDGDVVDWPLIERLWNTLPVVADPRRNLRPGVRVGWQALGIDAATLTPQKVLHLAQILKRSGEDFGGTVTVRMLIRPGVDDFGFGLRVAHNDEGKDGTNCESPVDGHIDREGEEVSFALGDTKEWRLIA
ncbi:hypothetical protein FRB98_007600 [Tulasnella sp. 332]|nr:hypothetical protein FRB98_007600 [Tulasnella sp. 332]